MQLTEELQGLVLSERGAELPAWLDFPGLRLLEQQPDESYEQLGTRACFELERGTSCAYVVVVLAAASHFYEARGLELLGGRLISMLVNRTKPRLLLCVPPETVSRKRKALLVLARELAQGESAVVIGAHFSARPPPSETLPVFRGSPKRRQGTSN